MSLNRKLAFAGMLLLLIAASLLPVPGPAEGVFCALRRITGYPCMTCGFTRAFMLVMHGQWTNAIRDCPLGACLPIVVVIALSIQLMSLLPGVQIRRTIPVLSTNQRIIAIVTLAALVAANWLYRLFHGYA